MLVYKTKQFFYKTTKNNFYKTKPYINTAVARVCANFSHQMNILHANIVT